VPCLLLVVANSALECVNARKLLHSVGLHARAYVASVVQRYHKCRGIRGQMLAVVLLLGSFAMLCAVAESKIVYYTIQRCAMNNPFVWLHYQPRVRKHRQTHSVVSF
jgi:hypothetical protein